MNDTANQLRTFLRLLHLAKWFFTILGVLFVTLAGYSTLANLTGHADSAIGGLIESIVFLMGAVAFLAIVWTVLPRAMRSTIAAAADQLGSDMWELTEQYRLPGPSATELDRVKPRPTITLPFETSEQVFWEGQWFKLEFSGCVTHSIGDFAGNLDVVVRSSPPLAAETVVDNLRLRVPGYEQVLTVLGYSDVGARLEVVFGLCELASSLDVEDSTGWQCSKAATLETVEVWWGAAGDRKLATLSCLQSEERGTDQTKDDRSTTPA